MASQRLIWPSGGTFTGNGDTQNLTTPGAVSAADSTYTGAQGVNNNPTTIGERYGTWGWDAVIPSNATITDVQLEYKWKGTRLGGSVVGHAFARISGTNQADHTNTQSATFSGGVTVGPFSIFSDRSWTRADLLDGTFEMVIRATSIDPTGWSSIGWDYIAVTVNWTVPTAIVIPPALFTAHLLRR